MERYTSHTSRKAPNILVVDDTLADLQLLTEMLKKNGYRVRPVPSGKLAIRAIQNEKPDLILLDIKMLEMNGYDVCEYLKADKSFADIPVVFISALDEAIDKIKAFAAGGIDYVTKPFQFEEVEARVQTHLKLHRLQIEAALQNHRLEELVQQRTAELALAYARLQSMDEAKSSYLSQIAHELRTPLTGLLGLADLAFDENLPKSDLDEMRSLFRRSRDRLMDTLNGALLLTQIETDRAAFELCPIELSPVLECARYLAGEMARRDEVGIAPLPDGVVWLFANDELLKKALAALMKTAVKHTMPGGSVTVTWHESEGRLNLQIRGVGHVIPSDYLADFWDVFAEKRPYTRAEEVGFGAAVAGKFITWMGGSVTVENMDPPGMVFQVNLRTAETPPPQEESITDGDAAK